MQDLVLSDPHPVEHIHASAIANSHITEPPGQRSTSPPGHDSESDKNRGVRTNLSWNQNLSIRFIAGNDIYERIQPVIYHTSLDPVPTQQFLMLCAMSLDMSKKELLYNVQWSYPRSMNDRVHF